MTRVKICGITNLDDALYAAECGADAIGFVFADSPRKIELDRAAAIAEAVPPFVARVGVFVNETPKVVADCLTQFLDYAQLHGDESVSDCERIAQSHGRNRVIKAFRVGDRADLDMLGTYGDVTGLFLLDTNVPGKAGGTGQTFDWNIAIDAKLWGKPIVLSGGLTPDNVAEAVARVRPYAVDVSSGVESAPGIKDRKKVREFVTRAKEIRA